MRLIDADALLKAIIQMSLDGNVFDRIHEAPTIEPERKTGKWYKPTGMMPPEYAGVYRCSECDGIAMRDWKTRKQMLTDFCPNCGAKMEVERKNRE